MAYGLNTPAFIENGPTMLTEQARQSRSSDRNWRVLDEDRRLALIERALKPANDGLDTYQFAL